MNIQKQLPLLEFLAEGTDVQQRVLVKTLTANQLKAVLEAIYNVLMGTCPLQNKHKKKLESQKSDIRHLVSKELSTEQKQQLLRKHSDLLPLLLKPVVAMLGNSA